MVETGTYNSEDVLASCSHRETVLFPASVSLDLRVYACVCGCVREKEMYRRERGRERRITAEKMERERARKKMTSLTL